MKDKKDFVLFGIYNNLSEIKVVESILESENIPYFIEQESFGKLTNITFDGLGEMKLYVHRDFLEVSKKLIQSIT